MKRVIVCYAPVPHPGYLSLFRRYCFADIMLVTPTLIASLSTDLADKLSRDMHAIHPITVARMLQAVFPKRIIGTLSHLNQLGEYNELIMPKEDISELIELQCPEKVTTWDGWFLRYDWSKAKVRKALEMNDQVTFEEFHKIFMKAALDYGQKSSDWWRQIGALVVKNGKELLRSYNQHMPSAQTPYVYGDIRSNLNAGESPELCTAHHAEIGVIAAAAAEGIALKDSDLYVSTFPCPRCVRSIITAKIKRVFFAEGYSILEGREDLGKSGVEVFKVLLE